MPGLARQLCVVLLLLGSVAGCSGSSPSEAPPPGLTPSDAGPEDTLDLLQQPGAQEDPFELFNRAVYYFNADFDRRVFLPVLTAYRTVTPQLVRRGVINFFSNLGELRNGFNGLLQARPEVAGRATIRLFVNTTAGLLGTIDVASELGVAQQNEDFGQTLGRWGAGSGPYLVLPFLGPSSIRDASGTGVDFATGFFLPPLSTVNEFVYRSPFVYPPQVLSERDRVDFRYYDSGSPFEYDIVRYLFLRKRELDIAS